MPFDSMHKFGKYFDASTEPERIVERTAIDGLYWIRNYFIKTSSFSRIVLPDPGQGNFSIIYHGKDFAEQEHGGYEVYGIHVGQTDVLTFLACDGRVMRGHFVDCRKGSPTLHREAHLEFKGDPEKSLIIDRGIAHIFDHLDGMITLNQLRTYVDYKANPDLNPTFDVINVPRGAALSDFPAVQVNRFMAPRFLCGFNRKVQRLRLREGAGAVHSFNFQIAGKTVTLTPKL